MSHSIRVGETHMQGHLSVENAELILADIKKLQDCDFGIQIAEDGRVWVCVDGIAFLRFKPKTGIVEYLR